MERKGICQIYKIHAYIYCIFIILLAFGLRIYNISDESVWWDEYSSLVHINVGSLKEFLFLNPLYDPATMPAYYVLEYLFWHYISPSVLGLRFFSVLLSVITIPILLFIGKKLGSYKIGLLAGLFFALSPIHRFFGQGIRMYVLLTFLCTLSIYFLLLCVEEDKKQKWIILTIINFVLLWTHPFAILIIGIEILWVLFTYKAKRYKKYSFVFSQIIISIFPLLYILNLKYYSTEESFWFKIPTLYEFLGDLFADDAVGLTYQVRTINEVVPNYLVFIHPIMDLSLLVINIGIILFVLKYVLKNLKDESGIKDEIFLLVLFILFPPIILYIISFLWRPCIFPRYTLYSSLAVYLLYGYFINTSNNKYLKRLILFLLTLIFCYQLFITLPGPQRTNWQKAVHFIEQRAFLERENSPVFVYQAINKDVFSFNMKDKNIPVSFVENVETFIPIVSGLFQQDSKCFSKKIWFIYVSFYFSDFGSSDLEQLLKENKIKYEYYDFYGIEPIRIYKITPLEGVNYHNWNVKDLSDESLKFTISDLVLSYVETGYKECAVYLLEKLIMDPLQRLQYKNLYSTLQKGNDTNNLIKSLRYYQISQRSISPKYKEYFLNRAIQFDKDLKLAYLCFDAIMTSVRGDIKSTKEKLHYIVEIHPDLALPRVALGVIALSQDREEEAKEWFYSATECEDGYYKTWTNLLNFIFVEKDYQKALHEYYALQNRGVFVESFFEEYLTAKLQNNK
ncbi:MAG TPA: glycosyltransferase family 39 protein [Candidatus Hydrogenedens sp.]|nr:glycosyltransferase family 39 protein [Candidatus Hydrogenedens sp.]HPP57549.1 glycosyltransferase family 39 protein [Candidatus Hydrogenedens sp.]